MCCSVLDCTCDPPSTLYLDLASVCSGWSGTITLERDALTFFWFADPDTLPAGIVAAQLLCSEGVWSLSINPSSINCVTLVFSAPVSGTCSPFYLDFGSKNLDSLCCPPSGGTVTAEVNE